MSIPIFKLPFLVQQDVLNAMDLQDVVILSTLSERIQLFIKKTMRNKPFHLAVDFYRCLRLSKNEDYRIWYQSDRMLLEPMRLERRDLKNSINFFEQPLPMEFTLHGIRVFWRSYRALFVPLIEYLVGIFPSIRVHLNYEKTNYRDFIGTIRPINQLDCKLGKVVISSSTYANDRLLSAVLNECSEAEQLDLHCSTTPKFNFDYQNRAPFKFKSLVIGAAPWVTGNHFLNLFMDCERVRLGCNAIGIESVLEILKKSTMENSALKHLKLDLYSFDETKLQEHVDRNVSLKSVETFRYIKLYYEEEGSTKRIGAVPYMKIEKGFLGSLEMMTD